MAQTYHIYDYKSLPARRVAILVSGLSSDSRCVQKLSGIHASRTELLLALVYDRIQWLCWAQTKDGHNGVNQPESIANILFGNNTQNENDCVSFESGEEFEMARKKILKRGDKHG